VCFVVSVSLVAGRRRADPEITGKMRGYTGPRKISFFLFERDIIVCPLIEGGRRRMAVKGMETVRSSFISIHNFFSLIISFCHR